MLFPWMAYAGRVKMWTLFLKEKISYADALRVVVTADLSAALSPTAVGGAPVKAALLLNRGFAPGSVGFMLTIGVIEDIIFYSSGIVLAFFFSAGLLTKIFDRVTTFIFENYIFILAVVIILAIYILLLKKDKIPLALKWQQLIPAKIKTRIYILRSKFYESLKEMGSNFKLAFKDGKLRMAISLIVLFIQWMSKFSVLIVILKAFNIEFDSIQIYIRQWVIYVTMLFIPTPGASGGAEASFLLIFGKSIPSDITYLVVSLWRLFTYYFILFSAVVFYMVLTLILKRKEDVIITKESS